MRLSLDSRDVQHVGETRPVDVQQLKEGDRILNKRPERFRNASVVNW